MCAQEFKVYRFNKTGKKVVCGTLEIKDSKYSLWFNFNIIVDIFEYESLGTFADLFTTVEDTETSISVFLEQEQLNNTNEVYNQKPKQASNFYKKQNITSDILALWDIENVNFYDDFRIITNLLPKESTKVFAYSKKNKDKIIYLKGNNLNFVLRKLKKRKWIEKRTIKSADNVLIEEFRQRKDKISHLYLITADKDFEEIATEAVNAGIKVTIMNKIDKASWFNCDLYDYLRV
jgi:uncharacterized protein YlbG (UPF0298 family)